MATVAFLLLLLGACDRFQSEVALTSSVDTLDGGGWFVRNARDSVWAEHDRWLLVEDLRIGTVDGNGPDVFGFVRDLTVDDAR